MEKIDKSLMLKSKNDQPGKPPAAKPLPSRWIPDDNPTPRVNVSYRKVPRRFHNDGKLSEHRSSFCHFVNIFKNYAPVIKSFN